MKDEIWNCRDGTKIFVKDMTKSHIDNVINMLIRKYPRLASEFNQFSGSKEDFLRKKLKSSREKRTRMLFREIINQEIEDAFNIDWRDRD